jgi:hypothetical protein
MMIKVTAEAHWQPIAGCMCTSSRFYINNHMKNLKAMPLSAEILDRYMTEGRDWEVRKAPRNNTVNTFIRKTLQLYCW